MNTIMDRKPTTTDVEHVEAILGDFPSAAIESCFLELGIDISYADVPRSFSKYFSVMKALSADLHGQSLVDFGCGLGVFVAQASKLGMQTEGIDVFTEYQGRCFEAAQCVASCISPRPSFPAVLTRLNFLTEEMKRDVDFVTSFGMLEHIYSSQARNTVLMRMMEALKPGGFLILTCGPNRRFPFDIYHYGPKFLFYHCLPVKMRNVYLRIFARNGQNQDPRWLNGMSVSEIKGAIASYGGEVVEQVFPLWVELAKPRLLKNRFVRCIGLTLAKLLTWMGAEPVILIIARKQQQVG